jgi:hypothetical protein
METADAETNWYDFLRNKVNSFIKWDLVRFFHDNPHTKDTAENIALYTGRDPKTIERELNGLVAVEVLKTSKINGRMIYSLTEDRGMRQLISDFMDACHDREFRVKAIHHVIRGMQFSPRHDF